jgi:YYY domain-containing protein
MAAEMSIWIRERRGYLLAAEGVFLIAFCFWAFVRSANPDLIGTEKPMELAFINAILGSPNFPPHDPWLSGYAISYYYFGYVLVSMLIRLTGASSGVGFNLAIALIFGLTALGAYGLVYNLLALARKEMNQETGKPSLGLPSLGPFFILIFSNIEGFLEMLHARGLFWTSEAGQPVSGFWKWLDIQELTQPPAQPYTWMPNRPGGIVWWRASRVLGDYNLQGQFKEIIDEFPFFSYLLADMHPHVLAMPFGLMMVGVGLHVYLRREEGSFSLLGWKIPFSRSEFFLISILLGGMAFLNTWDILAFTALISGAIVVARVRDLGWAWSRLGEFLGIAILFGIFAVLLYTPFYLGFASQAGGILPSFVFFTRGVQLWVMFFPLLIPLLALLVYTLIRERDGWKRFLKGLGIAAIIVAGLWVSSYALSYLASQLPTLGQVFLDNLGASGISIFQVFRDSLFGFTDPNGVTH